MHDDEGSVIARHGSADLEARLLEAVMRHAARLGKPPDQVVNSVVRFLGEPPRPAEVALAEMRHRVTNEMQMLATSMRRRRGTAGEAGREPCHACIGQVTALAQLNAAIDEDPQSAEVDLGEQALRFAAAARTAFSLDMRGSRLEICAAQLFVPRKVARNVLLILNEALTNAVKHGLGTDGGTIRILLLAPDPGGAELTVANEGAVAHPAPGSGSGRLLIDALAVGIGGTVTRFASEGAFRLTCRFPVPPPRALSRAR